MSKLAFPVRLQCCWVLVDEAGAPLEHHAELDNAIARAEELNAHLPDCDCLDGVILGPNFDVDEEDVSDCVPCRGTGKLPALD